MNFYFSRWGCSTLRYLAVSSSSCHSLLYAHTISKGEYSCVCERSSGGWRFSCQAGKKGKQGINCSKTVFTWAWSWRDLDEHKRMMVPISSFYLTPLLPQLYSCKLLGFAVITKQRICKEYCISSWFFFFLKENIQMMAMVYWIHA